MTNHFQCGHRQLWASLMLANATIEMSWILNFSCKKDLFTQCWLFATTVTAAYWTGCFLSSGQGDRRVFAVRVWELHAAAVAASWREEHYPWSQELSHKPSVWQHPTCKASWTRCPACQPTRCCHLGTTFSAEVIPQWPIPDSGLPGSKETCRLQRGLA